MVEEIVGYLQEVSGHTYDMLFDLYFTSERIIVVLIQSPGDVTPSTSWFTLFISAWGSRRQEKEKLGEIASERRRKSKNLNPDQLLTKGQQNSQIRFDDIVSVRVKKSIFLHYNLQFTMSVNGRQFNRNFGIDKEHVDQIQPLLEKLLPTKYKK